MSDIGRLIKDSVDIVATVREYVPRLQKRGTRWVAPCPFHNERTPSFGVNENLRIYKCFGCNKGGDVTSFVMEIEGITWWEAVKALAERNGIPLPKRSTQADEDARRRNALYEMHESALKLYQSALASPAGSEARAYLAKRGVTPALVEEFGLGLADRGGQTVFRRLHQAGFSPEQIESSGLCLKRQDGSGYFDRFRGRLMFPIHTEQGKIAGFAGRGLSDEDQPKYLNSPDTELYHKKLLLYNLHRARKQVTKSDYTILVEGYMDAIGLFGGGIIESVATCGTALGEEQIRVLRRFSEQVVINLDPDPAGAAGTERMIEALLKEGMRVRVLELPDGLDPDEFVLHHGADAYRGLIRKAPRYFHWLADRARSRYDMRSAEGRVQAFRYLLPMIQRLPGKLERAATADDLAGYLGVDKGMVLDELKKSAASRATPPPKVMAAKVALAPSERLLVQSLVASAEARAAVLHRLVDYPFQDPPASLPILKAMTAVGEPFDWAALEGRLDDRGRALLSTVVFADEGTVEDGTPPADTAVAQAAGCADALIAADAEARVQALKVRIAAAERAGNVKEAFELSMELERTSPRRRRAS
ncbi:MAG: DNA primase [Acidobacteria bacterium]|nr:DNA primase [Acidobacteriota bacterium]